MSSHDAFMQEIVANPEDLTPRLIYADWLDEQGDPRGEFIRVQCELATLDETDDRYPDLLFRERELLAEHRQEWMKPLKAKIRKESFRCGFVEGARFRFRGFLREANCVAQLTPLRTLGLTPSKASKHLHEMVASPLLRQLIGLEFHSFQQFNEILSSLIRLPELPKLRRLFISQCEIDAKQLYALLKTPVARHLMSLALPVTFVRANAMGILFESDLQLRQLDVSGNRWGAESVFLLANWPGLSQLVTLDLSGFNLTADDCAELIDSPHWGAIRHLKLGHYHQLDVARLTNQPAFSQLTALSMSQTYLNAEDVQTLVNSPYLGNLRRLELRLVDSEGHIDPLAILASWPQLQKLNYLHLVGRYLGDLKELFRSPYWNPKTLLSVAGPLTDGGGSLKWLPQEYPKLPPASLTRSGMKMGYLHDPVEPLN